MLAQLLNGALNAGVAGGGNATGCREAASNTQALSYAHSNHITGSAVVTASAAAAAAAAATQYHSHHYAYHAPAAVAVNASAFNNGASAAAAAATAAAAAIAVAATNNNTNNNSVSSAAVATAAAAAAGSTTRSFGSHTVRPVSHPISIHIPVSSLSARNHNHNHSTNTNNQQNTAAAAAAATAVGSGVRASHVAMQLSPILQPVTQSHPHSQSQSAAAAAIAAPAGWPAPRYNDTKQAPAVATTTGTTGTTVVPAPLLAPATATAAPATAKRKSIGTASVNGCCPKENKHISVSTGAAAVTNADSKTAAKPALSASQSRRIIGRQLQDPSATPDYDVLPVLACVLNQLCQTNDRQYEHDTSAVAASSGKPKPQLTKFHALSRPEIGVDEYLLRIRTYAECSSECFILALIYIDRLIKRFPNRLTVNSYTIHRLLITGVMLAAKYFDDVFFSNAYFAAMGGVDGAEINALEVEFAFALQFQFYVAPETYALYQNEIFGHHTLHQTNDGACGGGAGFSSSARATKAPKLSAGTAAATATATATAAPAPIAITNGAAALAVATAATASHASHAERAERTAAAAVVAAATAAATAAVARITISSPKSGSVPVLVSASDLDPKQQIVSKRTESDPYFGWRQPIADPAKPHTRVVPAPASPPSIERTGSGGGGSGSGSDSDSARQSTSSAPIDIRSGSRIGERTASSNSIGSSPLSSPLPHLTTSAVLLRADASQSGSSSPDLLFP